MSKNKDPVENKRSNYWCCIVYPDNCPEDWKKRLSSLHVKAIVSPVHSPDPDPETEQEKKRHYHVMFLYDSVKSYLQALEDFANVFDAGFTRYIVRPQTKVGMLKYFCHLSDPDKERLDPADVLCFGGVDYLEEISDDRSTFLTLMDMVDWIHNNHCCSFVKFLKYCQYNNLEWARIASTRSAGFISNVITSERNWYKDTEEENRGQD